MESKGKCTDGEGIESQSLVAVMQKMSLKSKDGFVAGHVKLNVGGRFFYTTIDTLTKKDETMLSAMFSGRMEISVDAEGWVLIDRSGKHFDTILNYLRDGDTPLPSSESEIGELLAEAKYYCIASLVVVCEEYLRLLLFVETMDPEREGRGRGRGAFNNSGSFYSARVINIGEIQRGRDSRRRPGPARRLPPHLLQELRLREELQLQHDEERVDLRRREVKRLQLLQQQAEQERQQAEQERQQAEEDRQLQEEGVVERLDMNWQKLQKQLPEK